MRIEYYIIAVYMLFMVVMGVVQRKFNKDSSDYFRGGCKGSWWLVGASAFMSIVSAYTFTAAAGVAFQAGWSVVIIYLGNALGFLVSFLFFAPWFRQLRATTTPEVIDMRFGVITQQFYAWFTVLQYVLMGGLPLYALSAFCAAVFGFNIYTTIFVIGGVVLLYVTIGGKWAVLSNDFMQCLILFSASILVVFLSYHKVGGFSGFAELVRQNNLQEDFSVIAKAGDFPSNNFTWLWAVAIFINAIMSQNALFAAPKYFAVKDGREAKKAAMFSCIMMLVGSAIWFLPPMVARLLYADEVNAVGITKPAEAAYAVISMKVLPNGMMGLVIVAMFSATMSSLDFSFNANAAIIVKNICPVINKIFKRKPFTERGELYLGQIVTVMLGLVVTGAALFFASDEQNGIFEIMLSLIALVGIPLATPMLLCLVIKRVPRWSALFSVGVAFVPALTGFILKWSFQQKLLVTFLVGTGAFVITKLFWNKASAGYKQKVEEFFNLMHKTVDFEKEVGGSVDSRQLKTLGAFVIPMGLFVCLLLFVPNELWGRLCILFVAGFILIIGGILLYFGCRGRQQENIPGNREDRRGSYDR